MAYKKRPRSCMVCVKVATMKYTSDSHQTKNWTNVLLKTPVSQEQWDWLQSNRGGFFHIHRSGTAIKFERAEDAELFILRWS